MKVIKAVGMAILGVLAVVMVALFGLYVGEAFWG